MRNLYRIADANLNRSREGIRVIEDIIRFKNNNENLSRQLKKLRHDISLLDGDCARLINSRDSLNDVGRDFLPELEGNRKNIKSIAVSNFRRVEESLRVLEEIYKILKPKKAGCFKKLRFRAYMLEKDVFEKL